jgi:hypothetical protein
MARRIYIKDGGLNTSPTIPPGYTALGSDSGDIKKKVVDTVSDVGGGGSGSYFKYVTSIYTNGDGHTTTLLYSEIISGGVIPDATGVGVINYMGSTGTASNNPYIDFNIQVYFPTITGTDGTEYIFDGWIPVLINQRAYDAPLVSTLYYSINGSINVKIDLSGDIEFVFDFAPYDPPIPIRVVITA